MTFAVFSAPANWETRVCARDTAPNAHCVRHNTLPAGMLRTSVVLDVGSQSHADSHVLISIGIPCQAAFNSHFVSKELGWYR